MVAGGSNPLWRLCGYIAVIKRFPVDPFWEIMRGDRPILDMWEKDWRNLSVVRERVPLRQSVSRPIRLVEIGYANRPFVQSPRYGGHIHSAPGCSRASLCGLWNRLVIQGDAGLARTTSVSIVSTSRFIPRDQLSMGLVRAT